MPRGGRRPGAGAPRGNINALRNGNYSRHMRDFYRHLRSLIARNDEPALRELIQACFDAGIFRSGSEITARHVPAVVRLWYRMQVDCAQSKHDQSNQKSESAAAPRTRRPDSTPASTRKNKDQSRTRRLAVSDAP